MTESTNSLWVWTKFTNSFWEWFIVVAVVAGIAGCFWLIRWQSHGKQPKGKKAESMGHVWDEDLQELNNPLPGWWLNLFYITLFFGVIYLILFPGLGPWAGALHWTSAGQYEQQMKDADKKYGPIYAKYAAMPIPELAKDREAMKTGARLFQNYCSVCHGTDGRGNPGGFPNLTDTDWLYGGKPEQIEKTILDGRQGTMPAWGAVIKKEGIFDVAEYVLSLSGRPHNPDAAVRGKAVFQQYCVACHGPDGKGNQMIGAPNLTDDIWLHGRSQQAIIQTITSGRSGRMPAHRQFLGEDRVHLLAAYVYGLTEAPRD
ncbi:MAG: cytochrome-c oxidase, cbb3-type subunit III [Acidiferrobacteraceae bacterium]|jgi:cytochrome c oxidase cbb3-type subunit 3